MHHHTTGKSGSKPACRGPGAFWATPSRSLADGGRERMKTKSARYRFCMAPHALRFFTISQVSQCRPSGWALCLSLRCFSPHPHIYQAPQPFWVARMPGSQSTQSIPHTQFRLLSPRRPAAAKRRSPSRSAPCRVACICVCTHNVSRSEAPRLRFVMAYKGTYDRKLWRSCMPVPMCVCRVDRGSQSAPDGRVHPPVNPYAALLNPRARTIGAVDLLLDVEPADGGVKRVDAVQVVVRACVFMWVLLGCGVRWP